MKKLFLFLLSVLAVGWVQAQDVQDRRPSAEEKALKQTEMIVRELHIDDSVQYHQLFDMHLRYARQYEDGCTRAQWLEKMESMNKDLQTIFIIFSNTFKHVFCSINLFNFINFCKRMNI